MKSTTTPLLQFASVIALGAAVLLSACSRTDNTDTTTTSATTPESTAQARMDSAMASATESWDNLKDYSYDRRAEFEVKAQAMAARLDQQATTATGEASRELAEARDELRTAASELSNATAETWESSKERVGRAWQKAEAAFENAAE